MRPRDDSDPWTVGCCPDEHRLEVKGGEHAKVARRQRWLRPTWSLRKGTKNSSCLGVCWWGKTEKRLGCGSLGTVRARRSRRIRESEPPVVVYRDNSAMVVEREVLRMGIEFLAVVLLTEVSLFHFEIENLGRTVQYKLDVQSLRLFGQHRGMWMTRIALVRIVCKIISNLFRFLSQFCLCSLRHIQCELILSRWASNGRINTLDQPPYVFVDASQVFVAVLPEHSSKTSGTQGREGIWNGIPKAAGLEQSDLMDASEFQDEKLNAKEVISPKLVKIPKHRRWRIFYWRRSGSEAPPCKRPPKIEEKCNKTFLESQTGLHQQQSKNSLHINTSLYSDRWRKYYFEKYFGKIGHEVLQQSDLHTSSTG